ncbi:unnamed protein product [Euphydryas editha]|uniref:Regulatory protein zeste n=1 Tax=Euphydryas editha TaxID=104508 RepID=A0AAU9TW63_EUPED|nr:unnamed protein product [Euphydryas editha]
MVFQVVYDFVCSVGTRRVSGQQLDILWEYLNSHRDIAVFFNRSLQSKEHSKRKWQEVAEVLNAQGDGAHKDWKSWSKYWVDYKAKLKRRVAALRLSQRSTGGGPSTEQPLSDIENKFLQILGEDYGQGLIGVQVEPFPPSGSTTATIGVESPVIDVLIPNQDSPASESILIRPPEFLQTLISQGAPLSDNPPSHSHIPFCDPPTAAPAAVAAVLPPRRRRRRREVPLSHEAVRRTLIQHSESTAQATINSS